LELGIYGQTFDRWKKLYAGLGLKQAMTSLNANCCGWQGGSGKGKLGDYRRQIAAKLVSAKPRHCPLGKNSNLSDPVATMLSGSLCGNGHPHAIKSQ
jgi:hypothetical protein